MFGQIKKSNYPKSTQSNRGFTLVELAIALIIIGIIAALALPNLLGFLSRQKVNQEIATVVGAIKEVQRQAMRQGKLCRININTTSNTLTGTPLNCLLSVRKINQDIKLRTNIPGTIPNLAFSYRGSTTKMGTIVVSSHHTDLQKCFTISLGTGISRTGIYTGAKTGSVSAKKCINQ
jgi:prepilin-type N-terminal cleavage/methylation domain-containing protein